MQENNELPSYSPEEVEQLIAMTEELQTENEQQQEELRKLRRQKQTDLSDNQRLSAELQAAIQDLKKLKAEKADLQAKLRQAEQTQQQSSELRTALSKIQTLTAKLSEQQQQIQKILSENRELQSQVRQLTAKNEKLNDSDRQLKHAEELKKQSVQKEKLLKEREKQAEDAVYKAKREAAIAITEANNREKVAKQAQEAAKKLTKEQEKIIRDKSNEQYEDFKMRYDTLATIVILYAVTVTIGLAVTSERIKADTIAFVKTIAFLFEGYYETACKLTTAAAGVGSGIQQPVVSVIITYLLGGIVALLCIAFILAGISSVGWLVYHVYQKYCWDEISPFVSLMSLAIVVSFASIMPLNIYLLLILSQIAYMIIRWLWEIKAIQGLFERIATRIEKWLDLKPNQQIGDLIIVFVIVVAVLTVRSWIKG